MDAHVIELAETGADRPTGEGWIRWIGNATVLIDAGGLRILTDPNFLHQGVDLALVHLGGTRVLGVMLTMDGEQGAEALEIIDPDTAIPIHYEEYTVMKSPLADFDRATAERRLRTRIVRLERGATFSFGLGGGQG